MDETGLVFQLFVASFDGEDRVSRLQRQFFRVQKGVHHPQFPSLVHLLEKLDREFRRRGVKDGVAQTYLRLGDLDRLAGDYDRAASRYREGLALFRELDETLEVASALHKLGQVVLHAGDNARATQLFRESLEFQCKHDNKQGIVECLAALAGAAAASLQWERAAVLFGAASAVLDRLGAPISPADTTVWQEQEEAVRQQMDPLAREKAWAKGQALTIEQAVELAMTDQPEEIG
jgi:tetratricopeptide (TPR) repeat protein